MSAYLKFLLIHLLGLAVLACGNKVSANTAAPAETPSAVEEKYEIVLAKYENAAAKEKLIQALKFIESHPTKITNKDYLTLIDYGKSAQEKRLSLINLRNGEIRKYYVAAGKGSDPDHDGIADSFSNTPNSYKTSLGYYLTLDDYFSEKFDATALRLAGLSSTNSNAEERAIVMHGAWYVDPEHGIYGRSEGCPALEKSAASEVIPKIKDGSLIMAYR